jgi:hypothetical protein
MAIQDFLSGGFYGKVGDVVGQRWHNKRYVKSYVKPTNPNTPAQQSNRGMFAKATKLAQIAFNINKGDTMWDTKEKGEFSLRVGTAMNRLKAGMSDTDALPLYPEGYIPSHTLINPLFFYISSTLTFRITCNDTFSVQGRTFGIVIHCLNVFTNQWEDIEYTHHNSGTVQFDFSWITDFTHAYPPGSTFTAATTDDALYSNSSVMLPSFAFQQTVKPTMSASITWGSFTMWYDILEFNPTCNKQILTREEETDVPIHIYSLYAGGWVDTTCNMNVSTEGGWWSGIELGEENEARPGTYITAGSFVIEGPAANINVSWPYWSFSYP